MSNSIDCPSASTDACAAAFRRTRYAFARYYAREGAIIGATYGAAVATATLLLFRAFSSTLAPAVYVAFAALPVGVLIGALLALRRTPSRETCTAITEDASHAGGLFLVANLPGAGTWPMPPPVLPALPKPSPHTRHALIVALVLLGAVCAAPADWFATVRPPEVRPLPDLTAELRNEIEDLQQTEQLAPEELAELKEELEHIAETAKATDPGTTLDAVDRVEKQLKTLLDLNAAASKKIFDENLTPDSLAASPEVAQALHQMIDESGWGTTISGEEKMPQKGDGDGDGNGDGDGDGNGDGDGDGDGDGNGDGEGKKIGSGSPSRGRADAKMSWTKASQMDQSRFKDRTVKPKPTAANGVVKTGESISEEDPARQKPASRTGGPTTLGGRTEGTTNIKSVSPRHRGTVKRFFEMERKHP